jgi:ribosomal protein L11 methyltransferase
MNNDYIEIDIKTSEETAEILMALLGDLPFEMFEENSEGVKAYVKKKDYSEEIDAYLAELQDSIDFSFEKNEIEGQNWNEVWESNFHPLRIGDFCGIRATFHDSLQPIEHELIINPKMAFGTGHHETTHLMIEAMQFLDIKGKTVLDYGCGTGILSFLAKKLGAGELEAIDNDYPAYESTVENAEINNTPLEKIKLGTLDEVEGTDFEIILANINRNVITASLSGLYQKLKKGGTLVTTGFLDADEVIMLEEFAKNNFTVLEKTARGYWICFKLTK